MPGIPKAVRDSQAFTKMKTSKLGTESEDLKGLRGKFSLPIPVNCSFLFSHKFCVTTLFQILNHNLFSLVRRILIYKCQRKLIHTSLCVNLIIQILLHLKFMFIFV